MVFLFFLKGPQDFEGAMVIKMKPRMKTTNRNEMMRTTMNRVFTPDTKEMKDILTLVCGQNDSCV